MSAVTLLLALAAAVTWGVADFSGGKVSRGRWVLWVGLVSQTAGLVLVAVVGWLTGGLSASPAVLPWGVASGAALAGTVLAFYRALAIGTMSVVAPIAATGVVVPVVVGVVVGRLPSALALTGIVVAVAGVVAAARATGPARVAPAHTRSVVLAAGAAVGFGLLQLTTAGGAQHAPLTTMVVQRATSSALLAALLVTVRLRGRSRTGPAGVRAVVAFAAVGVADVAANTFFAFSSVGDDLAVVAVLAALYPAVTVLLARVVDRERLGRVQQVGVGAAFAGVVMIALGS